MSPVAEVLRGLDWGNVPAWVGAVGSVGTLVIALFLLRGELAARRRDEEHYARQQVGAVSVWVEWAASAVVQGATEVVISNKSSAAIYNCMVVLKGDKDGQGFRWKLPVVAPSDEPIKHKLPLRARDRSGGDAEDTLALPVVELNFSDVYGRRWRLSSLGEWSAMPTG